MMKRYITILGTLVTVAILLSGSALGQPTHWIDHYEPGGITNCTNPTWAVGSPDDDDATVGVNVPLTLGILMLDLGTNSANWMGASQLFTVYGYSGFDNNYETYNITIHSNGLGDSYGPYNGWDSADLDFTTPALPLNPEWRYFEITGTSGQLIHWNDEDIYYGPEIDAVGW